ncbi:sulfurtransferase-like selenium metabolism protein YedF [Lutispora thermophila]|uniref:Selenium metabolism protein YedF n=1 Tax=Lutispora thermophila DSM 19022 TaxID=1122184 RepID=A0A1M6HY24_9FIRM|nr:sulfurtransferase-like selenium metabolism protein YedF [Lutispora thermophila]SHJ27122.1 selenium metabolism protein YedF [Lutispora thermophila DSM 19022]
MLEIDCRGLKCPEPVIRTKKALEEIDEGVVVSIVDNITAKENVSRLASNLNLSYDIEEKEGCFYISINKFKEDRQKCDFASNDDIVIMITNDKLGTGNDELGKVLMKSYLYALTEVSPKPKVMMFLNGGVKLTTEGSEVLENLNKLADAGVEIISCGTCLDFYGLKESLKVGIVGNMYSIVEKMHAAAKVINIG